MSVAGPCFDWYVDADDDVCILPLITANDNSVIAKEVTFECAEFLPPAFEELPYAADFVLLEPDDQLLLGTGIVAENPSPGETTPRRPVLCNAAVASRQDANASPTRAAIRCSECDLRFRCKSQLTRHRLLWHEYVPSVSKPPSTPNPRNRCRLCREQMPSVRRLEAHISVRHPQCAVCEVCLTMFHDQASLEWHRKYHVSKDAASDLQPPGYVCDVCGKPCSSSSHLHLHRKVHLHEKPYQCPYGCGRGFSSSGNRQKHVMRMHTHERKYSCKACAESFIYARQLQLHQERKHAGGEVIENSFTSRKGIDSEHTIVQPVKPAPEIRPFECTQCGKRFKQNTHLRNHLLTHTDGVRPHGCEFCPKRFALAGDLRIHRRIHTKEKPFQCHLCPAAFIMGKQLNKHRSAVHRTDAGGKPR